VAKATREDHFVAKILAACAFAREAALRWTTPDFTALSMAETYSAAAVFAAASFFAVIKVSSRLRNVLRRVLTPRLRSVRRTVLRAALIADFVLAMAIERLELGKNSNARTRVKGIVASAVGQFCCRCGDLSPPLLQGNRSTATDCKRLRVA
jgi:hypothetical protein